MGVGEAVSGISGRGPEGGVDEGAAHEALPAKLGHALVDLGRHGVADLDAALQEGGIGELALALAPLAPEMGEQLPAEEDHDEDDHYLAGRGVAAFVSALLPHRQAL